MGLRFQKRFKIAPGVTLNVGKRGLSTSVGVRGARVTFGRGRVRKTLGIPGTGVSFSDETQAAGENSGSSFWTIVLLFIALFMLYKMFG